MTKRRAWDFYPTEAWATDMLCKHVPFDGLILEPCNGAGDISGRLKQLLTDCTIATNDLNVAMPADSHGDASLPEFWLTQDPDWVVTNPPFALAIQILKHAHRSANRGVALLLRLTFLEPTTERAVWLKEHPPDKVIVMPRISFSGDGSTDSVTTAWFIWTQFATERGIIIDYPETVMFGE